MPTAVGRSELQRLLAAGAQLVEVLPKEEYDEEHLPTAVNLPLKQLDAQSAAGILDASRPVVVYCWDGL
jgi:rhodanese-related sulfurtransferase